MKYIFSNSSERDIKPTGTLKNMEGAHKTILIKIKNMPRAQILLFFFSWASSMHILPPQLVILESSTLTPLQIPMSNYISSTDVSAPQIQIFQDGIP